MLEPILFLAFINDLPECIMSDVRLFAYDTIVYRTIKTEEDTDILQQDLKSLGRWEEEDQMAFHPDKCNALHITRSTRPTGHSYTLHGHILQSVNEVKYLGVALSKDLNCKHHVSNTAEKENLTLGFLKWNLSISSPTIKTHAYKSLVRPQFV